MRTPRATIDGNGVIHVALQEYVYPANYSLAALRGLPLAPGVKTSVGVPRITVTSSLNGGASWTLRSAIDLANGAGTQFMPVITTVPVSLDHRARAIRAGRARG